MRFWDYCSKCRHVHVRQQSWNCDVQFVSIHSEFLNDPLAEILIGYHEVLRRALTIRLKYAHTAQLVSLVFCERSKEQKTQKRRRKRTFLQPTPGTKATICIARGRKGALLKSPPLRIMPIEKTDVSVTKAVQGDRCFRDPFFLVM